VQSDAATIVAAVAEPVGGALDVFDLPVEALGAGIGDLCLEEDEDRWPPGFDRLGQGGELGDGSIGAPGVEGVQPGVDLVAVTAARRGLQQSP
jgi:hypothetical protein